MREDLTPSQVRAARVIAAAADLLQIVLLPAFFPAAFYAGDVIDVIVAAVLLRLVGWHWAFLPTFLVEAVPLVDVVPTWTAAVFFATRKLGAGPLPTVVVGAPPAPPERRAIPPLTGQGRGDSPGS